MQTDVRVLKKKPMKIQSKYKEGAGDAVAFIMNLASDWFKRLARVFWAHL